MCHLRHILLLIFLCIGASPVLAVLKAQDQTFLLNFFDTVTAFPALNWTRSQVATACEPAWEGLVCAEDSAQPGTYFVIGLSFPRRGLFGRLPSSITGMFRILSLDLSHNQMYDPLPLGLQNIPWLDINLSHNSFQCPTSLPPTSISVANLASCDVSGNLFCQSDSQPYAVAPNCAALFPSELCRVTYCNGTGYTDGTASGFARTGAAANFAAQGARPQFSMSVSYSSPSTTTQCSIAVSEVLQVATTVSSSLLDGTNLLTNRSVNLLSSPWTMSYRATQIAGQATSDLNYLTLFNSADSRALVHVTMSESDISIPLYDNSVSLGGPAIKYSVEVHNFGASQWTTAVTGEYLSVTMTLSCTTPFNVTRTTVGSAVNLGLAFPSSNNLLSGRLRLQTIGSFDDQRTTELVFGYTTAANRTSVESATASSVSFRMHVKNAKNNLWFDPDLSLFAIKPPSAPPTAASPMASPPAASPMASPPAASPIASPPTSAGGSPVAGGAPQNSPIPQPAPIPSGIIINAPLDLVVQPFSFGDPAPVYTPEAPPTDAGGAARPGGLSGSNIALIVFACVLVVLITAIVIAVKWPRIKKAIARRRADQEARRAAKAMAMLDAVSGQPTQTPPPQPRPTAPAPQNPFAPPQITQTAQQPAPGSPSGWKGARKSKLQLKNG